MILSLQWHIVFSIHVRQIRRRNSTIDLSMANFVCQQLANFDLHTSFFCKNVFVYAQEGILVCFSCLSDQKSDRILLPKWGLDEGRRWQEEVEASGSA
jgi:hypothetical protein